MASCEKKKREDASGNAGVVSEKPWPGLQVGTSHEVWATQRVDHNLLLYVYAQGKKICPLRVDRHGPLPDPQPMWSLSDPQPKDVLVDDPTLVKCLKFVRPFVGRCLCKATCTR